MATSGTVSTTVFETRKLLEHAYRRVGIAPEQLSPDRVQTALDLLYLRLSALVNDGTALWALQREILPIYPAEQSVLTPVGTVEVLNCNLRKVQRMEGTNSSSEGTADNAFDGDLETECTQVTDGGWIQVQFESATRIPIFGILPNATGTWEISLQGSNDGISFTTFYTNAVFEAADGEWFWFDIEGMKEWTYIRLQAAAGTTLDVIEFFVGNRPNEIPLALVNRDNYENLPDKVFLGRPTEFWYDRQRVQPVITLWPAPAAEYTFYQIAARVYRHIEDVGTMVQEVEVPQRWYLPIMCRLAADVGLEDKEAVPEKVTLALAEADREWARAWKGESDSAPTYLTPNIGPYTR